MPTENGELADNSTSSLLDQYRDTRNVTEQLIEPLSAEDCQIQSMPDASPVKWHLAHTSWFFETFILNKFVTSYTLFNPVYKELFNSYYNAIGKQFSRPHRGVLSRPGLAEVLDYRQYVNEHMFDLLASTTDDVILNLTELGLQHEKQHQELILMDVKHALSQNPAFPSYSAAAKKLSAVDCIEKERVSQPLQWLRFDGGLVDVGADDGSFAFDNERPQHKVYLQPFRLANRLVTNGEYMAFMADNGYGRSEFWLSDGWSWRLKQEQVSPLYWHYLDGKWWHFTLHGLKAINPDEPVCHINYYEASAYAAWSNKRLPTEFEWEYASKQNCGAARYLSLSILGPGASDEAGLVQMLGDLWEWTSSGYSPYPGFKPFAGDAGEYNGKFMSNQFVLRGGSCITPENHIRSTYRNFFYPHQRWQFSGLRLAENIE